MPAPLVTSFAKKSGFSVKEVERRFEKAKGIAKADGRKEGDADFFPFVVGILKKMLRLEMRRMKRRNESLSKVLDGKNVRQVHIEAGEE